MANPYLSPEVLAWLQTVLPTGPGSGGGVLDGYRYAPIGGYTASGGGESGLPTNIATEPVQGWARTPEATFGRVNEWEQFDPAGAYQETYRGGGDQWNKRMAMLIASLIAGYAGSELLGSGAAATGGGEGAATLAGGTATDVAGTGALASNAVAPLEMADIIAALAPTTEGLASGGAMLDAGMATLASGAAPYSLEGRNYPTTESTQGPGGSPANSSMTPSNSVFDAVPWRNIAGAALGAASSQDRTTSNRIEPWAEAQPFLKDLLAQGAQLQRQFAQNPFTDQQKTAYNNLGGLLNTLNQQAPGLLAGFNASASGANNYDRANPRKQLMGSSFDLSKFAPGLLNFFPPRG